jgi:small subunit ribosomal protein S2
MEPYIYCSRNKIHIINLEKTVASLEKAAEYVRESSTSANWRILFVGTKRAATETIAEQAQRAGMPYINHRWLGGVLTNYKTIRSSVRRLQDLEIRRDNGSFDKLSKKEAQSLLAEHAKLERSLSGIKDMPGLPGALFIVDIDYESIAVKEAHRLGIPIVGIVDTNSNPEDVDYVIPSNDDSIRAIRLYVSAIADACVAGRQSADIPIHQTTQNKMTAAASAGGDDSDAPAKPRRKDGGA